MPQDKAQSMSANPALTDSGGGILVPTPFPGETVILRRPGIEIDLDGVRTGSGRWKARGTLFLTNIRCVFVADAPDPSGLVAFDLPLVYIRKDRFNQPIFGANNLSGECWPAQDNGGPLGSLAPHVFRIYFTEGGYGTFTSFYYRFREYYEAHMQQVARHQIAANAAPTSYDMPSNWQQTAFVDPNDPTTLYLSQPVQQQLPEQPRYSPLYGQDDAPYEGTGLRP